ncbi:MAG: carboxypeptidase M32 [Sandaracinaceae bacterium]
MPERSEASWTALTEHVGRLETLRGVLGLLGWDEATMMPKAAAPLRGRQRALLARVAHDWVTDPRIEGWLEDLEGTDDPVRRACRRNLGREVRREKRVPAELVEELTRAASEGFAAWLDAKRGDSFASFAPSLQRLLDLTRRRAEAIDRDRHPYDVLLEEYDPGTTADGLRATFGRLRDGLVPLLDAIAERPPLEAIGQAFDPAAQERLHRDVAAAVGYDFDAGRLDRSEHPFTSGHGPGDVRITSFVFPRDLLKGLTGTLHETGHALYEQGLPEGWAGTTVAAAASFGLHESQSRLWENFIGRSEPFCAWLAQRVAEHFPDAALTGPDLYRASNRVERGLIRVAADEVTYNLHIIVRFEIELALIEGWLSVADLPRVWSDKMEAYLGVAPERDAEGVLQDVHWSAGAFGYFPSYTLGNLYAASIGRTLEAELPTLWSDVGDGRFGPVRQWLRERVHRRGHLLEAPEILRDAVGERDAVDDLLTYLWSRHGALYGLTRAGAAVGGPRA